MPYNTIPYQNPLDRQKKNASSDIKNNTLTNSPPNAVRGIPLHRHDSAGALDARVRGARAGRGLGVDRTADEVGLRRRGLRQRVLHAGRAGGRHPDGQRAAQQLRRGERRPQRRRRRRLVRLLARLQRHRQRVGPRRRAARLRRRGGPRPPGADAHAYVFRIRGPAYCDGFFCGWGCLGG